MKIISFLILTFLCSISNAKSCPSDTTKENKKTFPYYIEYCTDRITDKSYAFGSKSLLCSNDGKKGFIVRISWENNDGEISYRGITVKNVGIGTCDENDKLFFLFEDETKFNMTSWNKFNCEGNSYFDLNYGHFDDINNSKLIAIRFENGRSFDSYTYDLKKSEQSFFIEAKKAIEKKNFVKIKCDD